MKKLYLLIAISLQSMLFGTEFMLDKNKFLFNKLSNEIIYKIVEKRGFNIQKNYKNLIQKMLKHRQLNELKLNTKLVEKLKKTKKSPKIYLRETFDEQDKAFHVEALDRLMTTVGSISFGKSSQGSYGRVFLLKVNEACRNRGIGTHLMRYALISLEDKGYPLVTWHACPLGLQTISKLIEFYKQCGGYVYNQGIGSADMIYFCRSKNISQKD